MVFSIKNKNPLHFGKSLPIGRAVWEIRSQFSIVHFVQIWSKIEMDFSVLGVGWIWFLWGFTSKREGALLFTHKERSACGRIAPRLCVYMVSGSMYHVYGLLFVAVLFFAYAAVMVTLLALMLRYCFTCSALW